MKNKINNIGILGRGFGLYGYFPALCQILDSGILIPQEYQEIIFNRMDLREFLNRIIWSSENEILANSELIINARRPCDNITLIDKLTALNINPSVILEKPIASNPKDCISLLHKSIEKNIQVYSGFIFQYTDWYKSVENIVKNISEEIISIDLTWKFKAHHYSNPINTWKSKHESGGGVLRFYAIHLLSMLKSLSFTNLIDSVVISEDNALDSKWVGTFNENSTRKINIFLDSNAEQTNFSILVKASKKYYYSSIDPFSNSSIITHGINTDPRCIFLKELLKDVIGGYRKFDILEFASFWRYVESKTYFEKQIYKNH